MHLALYTVALISDTISSAKFQPVWFIWIWIHCVQTALKLSLQCKNFQNRRAIPLQDCVPFAHRSCVLLRNEIDAGSPGRAME